jgi:hypothetical protein
MSNPEDELNNKFSKEISLFYSTKEKYKEAYDNKVDKIMKNNKLDLNSKHDKVKKIEMPCVFCKRKVNSIFSRKNHRLTISCGSEAEPCNRKFDLQLAYYSTMDNILEGLEERIQTIKDKVIQIKTKLLYNYISEENAIEEFEKASKDLNEFSEVYVTLMRKREKILNNEETQHLILQKQSTIEEYMTYNKELLEIYMTERTDETLNNYVENIIEILQPLQSEVYDLKYAFKEVIVEEKYRNQNNDFTKNNDNKELIYTLHSRNVLFENLDDIFDEEDHKLIQNDLIV